MINNQIILLKFIQINNNVDWEYISYFYKLSENFIKKFQNNVDCDNISSYIQKLSENFIREFQDKVNWYYISINQKLSEPFIIEFQNKVNWYEILINQKLSINFKKKFNILFYE